MRKIRKILYKTGVRPEVFVGICLAVREIMFIFVDRMMKKFVKDLRVKAVERLHERYVLLRLTDDEELPAMLPGQFAEVRVDDSPRTFLRRPISICYVDRECNELWLLVACVGDGTRRLAQLSAGDRLNCMLPLGNGWSLTEGEPQGRRLLVGGGVGVAPLLYLGAELRRQGIDVTFLLGARSAKDLLLLSEFRKHGRVLVTTEDGTEGERGFVTQHSVLAEERFDGIHCCGPTPMMKAVARYAREMATPCEVSLENLMACGLGACLCCVEKVYLSDTVAQHRTDGGKARPTGNVCVCKEGPVFDINRLMW